MSEECKVQVHDKQLSCNLLVDPVQAHMQEQSLDVQRTFLSNVSLSSKGIQMTYRDQAN